MEASEPTPAEDAAARAKEEQEQAALPYKWTQVISELDITFTVPGNYKSRDLVIEIKRNKLRAGVKGQDPIIDVRFVFHNSRHVVTIIHPSFAHSAGLSSPTILLPLSMKEPCQ